MAKQVKTTVARLASVAVAHAATAPQLQDKLERTSNETSRQYFEENAQPVDVKINGVPMVAYVKTDFNSGSFGWYLNGQMGHKLSAQCAKKDFLANAGPIEVQIAGRNYAAWPTFSSQGSCIWNLSTKVDLPVGTHKCLVQAGLNLSITNSKKLGDEDTLREHCNLQIGFSLTVVYSKTGAGVSI